MMKGEAARIISRRLNLSHGRVSALLVAASDAGILPKGSGKSNPTLSPLELAHLILAATCDRGIGVAGQSVLEFAALQSAEGLVLVDLIEAMIAGRANVSGLQSVVVQLEPAGVSVTTAGTHFRFGADHAGGAAKQVVIRGSDLAAAILELQGTPPQKADEQIAVGRLAAALN
ncbi:MAG: hypothetical protein J0G95_04555 [Rhizobiales bacterium]|nr:hypothetical protein [Hyphomicrobiales bacterium]